MPLLVDEQDNLYHCGGVLAASAAAGTDVGRQVRFAWLLATGGRHVDNLPVGLWLSFMAWLILDLWIAAVTLPVLFGPPGSPFPFGWLWQLICVLAMPALGYIGLVAGRRLDFRQTLSMPLRLALRQSRTESAVILMSTPILGMVILAREVDKGRSISDPLSQSMTVATWCGWLCIAIGVGLPVWGMFRRLLRRPNAGA